uniref:Glucosylceramidase n=1 Tax=Plectus sambesii TaxID=2011161 RepID=A0A914VEJ8_9BILA
MKTIHLITFSLLASVANCYSPCVKRNVRGDSQPDFMVCVCNATYCDDFPPLGTLNADSAAVYVSSSAGKRFERSTVTWTNAKSRKTNKLRRKDAIAKQAHITPSVQMQSIIGFGGAFTDSAGINLASLDNATQELLMQSYYGPNGLQYSLGRVPMASCDFSTHEYSYDDFTGDFALQNFSLTMEDYQYKIPYIKRAMALTGGDMKLFASPWSAPGWMKTNGHMKGGGKLKGFPGGIYDKTWAQYFVRFLEEYNKNGVNFWGLTAQNEPTTGADINYGWQTMFFDAESERDFIKNSLGPALHNSSLGKNIALMTMDDQRFMLPGWADVVFDDDLANSYTAGIAIHWYEDWLAPSSFLADTHKSWPDKFMLATEACSGYMIVHGPSLGAWTRADDYAHDIIVDLNNWVAGWTDWNIALDMKGGPNWVNNVVDAPIIIDSSKGEFYKEPMFYAMGHFSKFIRPNSVRIGLTMDSDSFLEGVAFSTPTSQRVYVIRNAHASDTYDFAIEAADRPGQVLHVSIEPSSITTIVWDKA